VANSGTAGAVNVGVEHPWVLALLVLCLVPFLFSAATPATYPWVRLIPVDAFSNVVGVVLRLLGAMAIAALVLGLSGLHASEQQVQHIAKGAQIVIVLDRSRSMNETFAGNTPTSRREESKAAAASRLLLNFINRRPDNVYGLVEFSSSPMYVLPLTTKDAPIRAALRAAESEGYALTNIASPLAMAAGYFYGRAYQGSRVVLLVSDGVAKIDEAVGNGLRELFQEYNVRLYWIYIPSEDSPGVFAEVPYRLVPVRGLPEQDLHRYFHSLGIPYTAYEARDPGALQRAVTDVDGLEQYPLRTVEVLPGQDLSGYCYMLSLALMVVLIVAKLCEVRIWQ
jgi:mxaC protein